MSVSLLILAILASGAQAPETQRPIVVTGSAWAPFISPMGEAFRSHGPNDDTLADWFRQADRNQDGMLTPGEMQADAERFFATLDTNRDGEIDPEELVNYEWQVAPEIQANSRLRRQRGEKPPPDASEQKRSSKENNGPQGAARYSLLNIPEPVAAADANLDRGISLAEFRQAAAERFQLLDHGHQGRIALTDLESMRLAATSNGKRRAKPKETSGDTRVGVPLPPNYLR